MGKKKGKPLEQLVKAIEETLVDHKNTKVSTNVKIVDNNGIKREFDVVVDIEVNSIQIKIVFECKDFSTSKKKTPVDIIYIDSFVGKCKDIPSINKKIMVSATGYTENAVTKAHNCGIELYSIDDVPIDKIIKDIQSWFCCIRYFIQNSVISYTIDNDINNYLLSVDDIKLIYDVDLQKPLNYQEILDDKIHEKENEIIQMALNNAYKIPYCKQYAVCEIAGDFRIVLNDNHFDNIIFCKTVGVPLLIESISSQAVINKQKVLNDDNILVTEYEMKDIGLQTILIDNSNQQQVYAKVDNTLIPLEKI